MATILIVDDLSANRQALVGLLLDQGHRLLEATNGADALAAVLAERPDLVITDVLMPVMNGYEFERHLRLDPGTSTIPVVFYTPRYGEREARAHAESRDGTDVLTKPADPDEVLRVVARALFGDSESRVPPNGIQFTRAAHREQLRLLSEALPDNVADLRAGNARLRALINIGLDLASERDPDQLLQSVCVAARELFGASFVTLGIVDPGTTIVQRFATSGGKGVDLIRTGDSVVGLFETVLAEQRTVRGNNSSSDEGKYPRPVIPPDVETYLAAPIASTLNVHGWICLGGNEGKAFTDDDEQLVLALAGWVGRIYELEHEIRERKQAELAAQRSSLEAELALSALRSAEERTRFALDAAGVGIWDMDYTTGWLQWSGKLEAQYGMAPGSFPGTFEAYLERVHPDDRKAVVDTVEKAMKEGADFSVQHRTIMPDNTVRWLTGAGRVLLGEDGLPARGVGVSLDVTDRRTLEEQYQQAQKMEAIGRLAGGVAHDFNNLLTVILGYSELLLADLRLDDDHRMDAEEIQRAGRSAALLTRQLLAFSRKQIIEPMLLDLNVIVSDMRAMLGRLIGEDVQILLGLPPDIALVMADRGQVEQVVMNLALNARDAMPTGGKLTIQTANIEFDSDYAKRHPGAKIGHYVALLISDTGTGMTPQVKARLFEPFFTTKEPGKGTGLGLATVHGIVTAIGGSVEVTSEIGEGSSFSVYFPRADVAPEPVKVAASEPLPKAGTQTVLVVEDAEGLRELTSRMLQRLGYTVLGAANAEEAVVLFDQNPSIDVLLTDVVMPGASGPELTRQLAERRPGLKVVFMSGYTEDAIVHHGVRQPGIAFLHKPFTSESLGRKIREVLERVDHHG